MEHAGNAIIQPSGTLSQKAEKNIIRSILDFENFYDHIIQRKLAYYPFADFDEKNDLICELMDIFWMQAFESETPSVLQKFNVFRNFDLFLTATGRRGHFIHQFEVFLLGLNVILAYLRRNGISKDTFLFDDRRQIFFTWLMSSSAHDFGLPLEVASDITDKLIELYNELGMTAPIKRIQNQIYEDRLPFEGKIIPSNTEDSSELNSISAVQYNLKWVLWPLWNQAFGRVFWFFENQVASFFFFLAHYAVQFNDSCSCMRTAGGGSKG